MSNTNHIDNIINILNDTSIDKNIKLYNDMSRYQKELFSNLKQNPNDFVDYSLTDLIFDFDINFVQYILQLEIESYLKECKDKSITNKRNGSTKNICLKIGDKSINFNRPRLRNEKDFNSVLIPKRTRILKDLSDNIMLLYAKNNSVNDIKDILKSIFHIDISTATISNFTQQVAEDVLKWRNRDLEKFYFTINIDCTYITLRDNPNLSSHKIPVYIAIGTKIDGHKEILGIYLGNEDEEKNVIDNLYNTNLGESKTFWLTVFNDLKDRGIKEIMYIVSDGIPGIVNAINDSFPNSKHQRCIIHLVRNLKEYTNKNNIKSIIADFKKIYSASNKALAIDNYNIFVKKYCKQKTIIKKVEEYFNYILPLFNEPESIRKYIYTNNIAESTNSKIKRGFYGRGALPNASSALNIIYFNVINLEQKWKKSKVANWDNIYNELYTTHYEEIKNYI